MSSLIHSASSSKCLRRLRQVLLVAGIVLCLQPLLAPGLAHADGYATVSNPVRNEKYAARSIRSALYNQRKALQAAGFTYSIGYTAAVDHKLPAITGGIAPPYKAMQEAASAHMQKLIMLGQFMPSTAQSLKPRYDLRQDDSGFDVTPVRDQGECGSCWVFGAVAAFEGSIGKITRKSGPDTSEQHLLDCTLSGGCSGGWHTDVFDQLTPANASDADKGTVDETTDPYTGQERSEATCAGNYLGKKWDYVRDANNQPLSPDELGTDTAVQLIKQAIMSHGPVATGIIADANFQAYTGGVFKTQQSTDPNAINHVVAIIGWDDNAPGGGNAWIVKNSWGTGWGSNCDLASASPGYVYVDYKSAMIGYGAAYIDAQAPQQSMMQTMSPNRPMKGENEYIISDDDSGATLTVTPGAIIRVRRRYVPGTGYFPAVTHGNPAILSQQGGWQPGPNSSGVPGREELTDSTFNAMSVGDALVVIENKRGATSSKTIPPLVFTISVQQQDIAT